MVRTPTVFALFLGAPLLSLTQAMAQDAVSPELGDVSSEEEAYWETNTDGLWDAAWDDSWTEAEEAPGPFALHLTAGRRTDLVTPSALQEEPTPTPRRMSEVYALATLQVPLESLFFASSPRRGKTVRSLATTAAPEDPAAEQTDPPQGPQEKPSGDPEDVDSATSPVAPPSVGVTQTRPPNQSESSSSLLAAPPSSAEGKDAARGLLRLVRELAKRVARAESKGDRRLHSLVRRSRLSGLVPEVRFRGVYGLDQQTSTEDAVGIYPGETTTRGGRDSLLEARLTFRLDRLVLGAGEDSLERQRAQRARESRESVTVAVETLMKWRVAVSQSEDPSLLPEEQLRARVNAESALAELYLLTDGWFVGQATLDELGVQLPALTSAEAP